VASGLNLFIEPYANPTSLYAIYLLSTLVIALSFGWVRQSGPRS